MAPFNAIFKKLNQIGDLFTLPKNKRNVYGKHTKNDIVEDIAEGCVAIQVHESEQNDDGNINKKLNPFRIELFFECRYFFGIA